MNQQEQVKYRPLIRDLLESERPRERLQAYGPGSLSTSELLAILLHQILRATEIDVNSSHHQAVDKLAPGLRALAQAPDGIVEAVQMTDRSFFLAVQWHPERIFDRPEQRRLFKVFVSACQ